MVKHSNPKKIRQELEQAYFGNSIAKSKFQKLRTLNLEAAKTQSIMNWRKSSSKIKSSTRFSKWTYKYCWGDAEEEGNYWSICIYIRTVHSSLLKSKTLLRDYKRRKGTCNHIYQFFVVHVLSLNKIMESLTF